MRRFFDPSPSDFTGNPLPCTAASALAASLPPAGPGFKIHLAVSSTCVRLSAIYSTRIISRLPRTAGRAQGLAFLGAARMIAGDQRVIGKILALGGSDWQNPPPISPLRLRRA
jgi:hypothetical protein